MLECFLMIVLSLAMFAACAWVEILFCKARGITVKEDMHNTWVAFRSFCKDTKAILSGWVSVAYTDFCDALEMFRRNRRPRHIFDYSLECDFRAVLKQYAFNSFEPYINVIYTPIPSVIQVGFITQKAATDEIAIEVMEHIVAKFRHYQTACNLSMAFFPYYYIQNTEVCIFIIYCEYQQELPDFYKIINSVVMSRTDGSFGTLKECHIPKSNGNDLILGYSATKWNSGGIVSPYILECKKDPHALFAGPSGSSKTCTVQLLVRQLMYQKKDIVIADFKAGKDWDNIFHADRYGEYTGCDRIIDEFYNSFIETIKNKQYRERYLVCDEFGSYVLSKDSKEKKALMEKISHIAFMGRSFGFHLILINQQFNADILPTAIREQFATRVHMGNRIYTETATMLFPNVSIDKSIRLPNYHGYIATPQTDVDIIVIPELSNVKQLKKELQALGQQYYT